MSASACWWCGKKLVQFPNHTKRYTVTVDGNEVAVHQTCQPAARAANTKLTAQPSERQS